MPDVSITFFPRFVVLLTQFWFCLSFFSFSRFPAIYKLWNSPRFFFSFFFLFTILMSLLPGPLTFLEKILFTSTLYQLYSRTYYLRTNTQIHRVLSFPLCSFLLAPRAFLFFFFFFFLFRHLGTEFEARTSRGSRRCETLEFPVGYRSRIQSWVRHYKSSFQFTK